jgi:hypothetical protein
LRPDSLAQVLAIIQQCRNLPEVCALVSTYTSYRMIAADMTRSLQQVEKQPMVERETKYYLENIGKVKSIDDFVSNTRLFKYAMKAMGLQDMDYAKAFIKKALEGGIKDDDSFANKLTDKRYAEFVKTFNFFAYGEDATVYNPTQQGTTTRYQLEAVKAGVSPDNPTLKAQVDDYLKNIKDVKSIDDFLADDSLLNFALKAYGLSDYIGDKDTIRKVLEGGVTDPNSFANKQSNTQLKDFAAAFDFVTHGEETTTWSAAQQPIVDKYARQTLEENAGQQSDGVRLALYFQRKASSLTGPYQILADKALGEVVRTALGLPDGMAQADIEVQASMLEKRLDFDDFQDPAKLDKFLARFTTMWEIKNGSPATRASPAVLFSQPAEFGISTDMLLQLQQLRK